MSLIWSELIRPVAMEFAPFAAFFTMLFAAHTYYNRHRNVLSQIELIKRILLDAKNILENPPPNGFDYAPTKPDFGIKRLDEAIATKNLLSRKSRESISLARENLFEIDSLIDQAQKTQDPVLKRNINFRGRFPELREKTCSNLDEAIKNLNLEKPIFRWFFGKIYQFVLRLKKNNRNINHNFV